MRSGGHDYYRENRVRYISLDKTRVRAIVEGTQPYKLECDYIDGEIRNLVCDCFCTYACKHMFAAMLQLKEILAFIEKHYPGRFEDSRYFARRLQGNAAEYRDGRQRNRQYHALSRGSI